MEKDIFGPKGPEEIQLPFSLAGWEVFPSEIKQPSADYVKSRSKQFYDLQSRIGKQTKTITLEDNYLMGQYAALEEIRSVSILTGKKETTKVGWYDVVYLLRAYEECYTNLILNRKDLELVKKPEGIHEENQCFFCEGSCDVLRELLMEIGQNEPADKIQTRVENSISEIFAY